MNAYDTHDDVLAEGRRLWAELEARQQKRAEFQADRAMAPFLVKESAAGRLTITGLATSATVDRMGDIVEPDGAIINLPVPFLLSHDASQPIGQVVRATRVDTGITIEAHVQRGLSPRIDEAATLIRAGLFQGLSIGFRGLASERIGNTGGLRFKQWELLEVSAVAVPANPDGRITAAKHWRFSQRKGKLVGKIVKVVMEGGR